MHRRRNTSSEDAGVPIESIERAAAMHHVNPYIIARNHRVEEALAAAEAGDVSVLERLLGIELLSSGKLDAHTELLRMCADNSDAAASAAWTAMFRLNPDALIPVVPTGRNHPDAFVRMTAARIMRLFPDAE